VSGSCSILVKTLLKDQGVWCVTGSRVRQAGDMLRGWSGGGVFYKRILGVGSDDLEWVGFEMGVGDNHRMSHPL
jgi:hypothetical protein